MQPDQIGALIGLGIEGEEGAEAGAALGAEEAEAEGIDVFSGAEEWDVLADIPNDSAAALRDGDIGRRQWRRPAVNTEEA